ncbi:putative kinase [Klebsiella pneumoniae]|uniref:Putative kinase n=1 Tax=Klebsiella pneumoniae TaxID=573 RepID=A0A377TKQ6_KLEPN|nr:putative kinase [Klebsiella pneumoniae]
MSNIDTGGYTSSTGRSLDPEPGKGEYRKNSGDAIREVFGRVRIYPDYVVQPVTRLMPPILRKCASRCCCVSVSVI